LLEAKTLCDFGFVFLLSAESPAALSQDAGHAAELAAKLTDPNDRRATELMASDWEKVADERETKLATKQDRDRYRLAPLDVRLAL
jgi:hypothetical protein